MQEFLLSLIEGFGLAYWVEIKTELPRCTYYFGPFFSAQEAGAEQAGYIEDLEQEGARTVSVLIKRCKPSQLTILEEGEDVGPGMVGQWSSQMQ